MSDGRLCVPAVHSLRKLLLAELHDTPYAGHRGALVTISHARKWYFWPAMLQTVTDYVRGCPICQRSKSNNQRPARLLQQLAVPERPWQDISMDLVVRLPPSKLNGVQFDAIVSVRLKKPLWTKMVHLAATRTDVTAPELANVYMSSVFRLHGMPESIVSDRDSKFISRFWKAFFGEPGHSAQSSPTCGTTLQTDGQTERTNRTVEDILRAFVNYEMDNLAALLPMVEFAINNARQASTQEAPFVLNYGSKSSHARLHALLRPSVSQLCRQRNRGLSNASIST